MTITIAEKQVNPASLLKCQCENDRFSVVTLSLVGGFWSKDAETYYTDIATAKKAMNSKFYRLRKGGN